MRSFAQTKEQLIYWTSIGQSLLRRGDSRGYYVLSYPKSGSNWMCNMLSTYFRCPVLEPWKQKLPVFRRRVYHLHRILPYHAVDPRTVYMLRDGRDVFVSFFFSMLRSPNGGPLRQEVFGRLGRELGEGDVRRFLGPFIDVIHHSRWVSVDYHQHVTRALGRSFCIVKFEELLADPVAQFTRVVETLSGDSADRDRVASTVADHDFRNQRSDRNAHFLRSGSAGDWRDYFTRRSAATFWNFYGEAMQRAGYEPHADWIQTLPED